MSFSEKTLSFYCDCISRIIKIFIFCFNRLYGISTITSIIIIIICSSLSNICLFRIFPLFLFNMKPRGAVVSTLRCYAIGPGFNPGAGQGWFRLSLSRSIKWVPNSLENWTLGVLRQADHLTRHMLRHPKAHGHDSKYRGTVGQVLLGLLRQKGLV